VSQPLRAAYTADRAAAIAGIPKSTVHYWARTKLLIPGVSAERVKLWSYSDVIALRIIGWLRQSKQAADGAEIPPTRIPAIRRALDELRDLDLDLWSENRGSTVLVDRAGQLHTKHDSAVTTLRGQRVEPRLLDLLAPFQLPHGPSGPDLRIPRPNLRIIPGKLAGSPHIVDTRVETVSLGALAERGMSSDLIAELYPSLSFEAIADALSLEGQLARNLEAA